MRCAAKEAYLARRAQTMPGVGPITALALETFAPDLTTFRRGRDFAAWLGLVPTQHSTGGKARLGKTSKMRQRDIRTLLVTGALARAASRRTVWQAAQLLADPDTGPEAAHGCRDCACQQVARGLWAMMTKQEDYRNPASAMA